MSLQLPSDPAPDNGSMLTSPDASVIPSISCRWHPVTSLNRAPTAGGSNAAPVKPVRTALISASPTGTCNAALNAVGTPASTVTLCLATRCQKFATIAGLRNPPGDITTSSSPAMLCHRHSGDVKQWQCCGQNIVRAIAAHSRDEATS